MRLFLPGWLAVTVASAISTWHIMRSQLVLESGREKKARRGTHRYVRRQGVLIPLLLFCMFLTGYLAWMLIWDQFDFPDNSMFTLGTLRGHNLVLSIWRDEGRFFPLGHQEFNLIRHFTNTAIGYQCFSALEVVGLSGVLLLIDLQLSVALRAGLAFATLTAPSIFTSLGGLIYPERNLILCLACFLLCMERFEMSRRAIWAVCAVICAQWMIYYKEVGFVLLLGFSVTRLVCRCTSGDVRTWNLRKLKERDSRLDFCFVGLVVVFLIAYAIFMLPNLSTRYAQEMKLPRSEVVLDYLALDWLAWLLVLVLLTRIYLILRGSYRANLLWDSTAIGGVAYFGAYLWLGMYSVYYLAPVDLIAILYLGRMAVSLWQRGAVGIRVAVVAVSCAIGLQGLAFSAFRTYERKNVIHGKAEAAQAVKTQVRGVRRERTLFFPFSTPYSVMEFGAYMSSEGVPVEGTKDGTSGSDLVLLAARSILKDGRCVTYRPVLCRAGAAPRTGDLVIVLPDDDASAAEAATFRQEGELLLHYEPFPHRPQWFVPYFRRLHVASYAFAQTRLPDRWPDASVTLWK